MGYYTGKGVTSGGGSTVSVLISGYEVGGYFVCYQRSTATTNRRSGVSLEVAQGEKGESDMRSHTWPGGMQTPACKGTRKNVSYSQINGSNLYDLSVTTEVIEVKLNDGGWNG